MAKVNAVENKVILMSRYPVTDRSDEPSQSAHACKATSLNTRGGGGVSKDHCSVNKAHGRAVFCVFFLKQQHIAVRLCRSNHEFELTWYLFYLNGRSDLSPGK